MELDDAEYRLKPMNCPRHILIYKKPASYRDLPVRYAELGNVYRYERSGTMHGLLRVRGFTQDDAHIFARRGRLKTRLKRASISPGVLKTFGFKEFKVELSLGPEKSGRVCGRQPTGRRRGGAEGCADEARRGLQEHSG
jgi:threonyl-tRNA synthetase